MSNSPLYDKQKHAHAIVIHEGVTAEDIQAFCRNVSLEFAAMGCPAGSGGLGWDDPAVFRAATISFPQAGVTIALSTVVEWKAAMAAIGDPIASGGIYQHYKGARYVTICAAIDESGVKRIVYRAEDNGSTRTIPWDEFFGIVKVDGKIEGRFVFVGRQQAEAAHDF